MLPADDAAARWFDEWPGHCERDATRPLDGAASPARPRWVHVPRTARRRTGHHHSTLLAVVGQSRLGTLATLRVGRGRASRGWGLSSPACQRAGVPALSTIGPTNGFRYVAHGDPAFLEILFDRDVRVGDDANLLLASVLNDQRAAVRTVAVDVTISRGRRRPS